jgi:hypothetical protein
MSSYPDLSKSQANLNEGKWTVDFKTTVLGLALEPGDVIDLTHSSQPAWNQKLFRVENLQYGDDDRFQIQASEYFAGAYV